MKWLATLVGGSLVSIACAADPVVDWPMLHDPELAFAKTTKSYEPKLPGLWIQAMGRPEVEHKTQAAMSFVIAKQRGMPGLEVGVASLLTELTREGQHPTARLAAAKALSSLDAKEAIPAFLKFARGDDAELRTTVDLALARWDVADARSIWIDRITLHAANRTGALDAVRALGQVREPKAVEPLREILLSSTSATTIKLESARSLASIRTAGGEADAKRLAVGGPLEKLLAATILSRHSGDEAIAAMKQYASAADPVPAAIALRRLLEIDPAIVESLADISLASPDANVRSLAVAGLAKRPSPANIAKLADRFNDPHPDVRRQARLASEEFATKAEWKPIVIKESVRLLGGSDGRGQAQASLLLGKFDHKPAANRLIEVLSGDRGEAVVNAAWALRKLAVPESFAPALAYVRGIQAKVKAGSGNAGRRTLLEEDLDIQLGQLVQMFGMNGYREADATCRELMPPVMSLEPTAIGPNSRAASIWALGKFHEGKKEPSLIRFMTGRVTAVNPGDFEHPLVRRMAAIGLGRMKADGSLSQLRQFYPEKQPGLDEVNNACGWAIEQITGEKVPPAPIIPVGDNDWYLQPTR